MKKIKQWGIFVIEEELDTYKEMVGKEGFDIFEVRQLTMLERLQYLGMNAYLSTVDFYVIMFNTTWLRYKWFIFKNRLKIVF